MEMFYFARFHAGEDQADALAEALAEIVRATRADADCLAISVFRSTGDPRVFQVHSHWTNDAAFDRHAQVGHAAPLVARVRELVDQPLDGVRTYRLA